MLRYFSRFPWQTARVYNACARDLDVSLIEVTLDIELIDIDLDIEVS